MQTQYSYEIICIFIKLPENFLLTFLDAKSLMMVSTSISFNNCFSMHNVVNPFNLSCEELCDYIKLSIRLFFFILLLSEAYFLDDMVLLKFREIIS